VPSLSIEHDPGPLGWVLDWVDSRFGPLQSVTAVRLSGQQPRWWVYNCALSRSIGVHYVPHPINCNGASIDGSHALQKSLGEAVERHCWHNSYTWSEIEVLPASQCAVLDSLPACAPEEKCDSGFKGLSPHHVLRQTRVRNLATGESTWLPANFVHANLPACHEVNATVPISTGAAFHGDVARALWSALCEVAERDAVMLCWLNQISAPRIDVDVNDCPALLRDRLVAVQERGLKATFWDVSTDFRVPTVLCLVSANQYPYRTVGAACCADPVVALAKSLDEVVLVRSVQISGRDNVSAQSTTDFDWVFTLEDHSNLYALWPDTPAFRFLMEDSPNRVDLESFVHHQWWRQPEDMGQLKQMARQLNDDLGLTVLWADITSEEVRGRGACVKVVVPEMVPLAVASASWLATRRLIDHAQRNGRSRPGVNPYPHPFP
jgi:ribosomal protein S12 methylthiotransferase accessory factor